MISYVINKKNCRKAGISLSEFLTDIQIALLVHSKIVINTLFLLSGLSLAIRINPPFVRLIRPRPLSLVVNLIPWLRAQHVVHVLDLIVSPDLVVHALPTQRLQRIVSIRQRNPSPAVQVRQEGLVCEIHVYGVGLHVRDDLRVEHGRGVDDLEAAVHEAQGADGRVCADGLGKFWVAVLVREGAVFGDPVLGVVRLAEGVADAGVAGGEDAFAGGSIAGLAERRGVEVEGHELVHVAEGEHVRVELDDARVLREGEGNELAPAVVEARVVGVVLAGCREEVFDALGGDAAGLEGGEAGLGEGVCVEGDKRVFGGDGAEGVVEGEEAGEVVEVGDEGCPDWERDLKLVGVERELSESC